MRASDQKGMSPVVTTIIIVAVGIPVAIALAICIGGLVATFTRFEKLEITNVWASLGSGTFTINMSFTNTGSSDATVTAVMINGIPYDRWSGAKVIPAPSISAPVGKALSLRVEFPNKSTNGNSVLTSGVTVTITLHTSNGEDYPKYVPLP